MRRSFYPHVLAIVAMLATALLAAVNDAAAQRGARGGAGLSRGGYSGAAIASRTSINRNMRVNQNINVNRNINIDVDQRIYRPGLGTAAVVAGAAVVTAAAIGSVAYAIPPSCMPVVNAGLTYQQCGSTWYQPQYAGSSVTYIVVNPPY